MTAPLITQIVVHEAPGELRAAALDGSKRPYHLFLQRWGGSREAARCGALYNARVRRFADEIGGAFLELETGEEVFLRLKSRQDLTEGAALDVTIVSEARSDKLARANIATNGSAEEDAFARWQAQVADTQAVDLVEDHERVELAFDEALAPTVTLEGGGQLHIDRARALTAFDLDTSGRLGKGSAGARALAINREAARELVRQSCLRGLGGNLVLDCVAPLNAKASEQVQAAARTAFAKVGLAQAKVLRPSALDLMEASMPWRYTPIEDRLNANPAETEMLAMFRAQQREAKANPSALYALELSKSVWQAYLNRRTEADHALQEHFSGRVTVGQSADDENRMQKR